MSITDHFGKRRTRSGNGGPVTDDKVDPLPDFIANGGLAEAYREQAQRQTLPAVTTLPSPSPLSDPLHPLVTELINKAQIVPTEAARGEAAKNKAAMLAELQRHIEEDDRWWDSIVEQVKHRAAVSAALHVKLRAFYDAMASARAAYDSPELPAVPVAPATEEANNENPDQ